MKLIAHRGIWNKLIKDNSYEALKLGLSSDKYIGIECDIRMTLDKVFIIYHNILYKGKLISSYKYRNLDNIPKLEDILKIKSDKIILLEIKDFNIDIKRLIKLLDKYDKNIYIMSFDSNIIKKIKKLKVRYKLGVLNYILNSDSNYDLDFICLLDIFASDKVIKNFEKRNIEVIIYGVININKDLIYIVDDYKINDK